ncbi:MAG: deoxyribonuclease IV [Bacilli bacterium]|nr:deoxyribonuclease IV [Bacilli bacterium]CDE96134.1 probable endonuclease 4 [Clostridium sp. CAG:914]
MNELIIGSHVSFNNKDQLLGAVKEAVSYGSNTFMFYTGAPQNTRRGEINDFVTLEAYKLMKENNIELDKVIVHAPYIVNLANPDNMEFSIDFLTNEVERCNLLGMKYLVLHPGSSVNVSREEGIANIIKGLNAILTNNNNICICLETMAGKGNELGRNFLELKEIIDGVNFKDSIGVCMDTCHLFDSGIDITDFDKVLDDFDKQIGLNYLKCIHINDSKNIFSSHKDRHENIGYGNIGFDILIKIIYNERIKNIPKILETPYVGKTDDDKERIYPPYKYEIEMIRNKKFDTSLLEKIRNNE